MQIADLSPKPIKDPQEIEQDNREIFSSNLSFYRNLGRTNLTVSKLGIGGGGMLNSEDTLYAFDRGINYFFYSSDLHHYMYSHMAEGLRKLCGRGSSVREQVVLATVSYIKNPDSVMSALMDQFIDLKIDYIDIFFWGWIGTTDEPMFDECMNISNDLRGANSLYKRAIEKMMGTSELLKKMGAVRYIGASFHDLRLASQWLDSSLLDVVMVRHNIAHRTAQDLVFNRLDAKSPTRPGVVTFKSAGMINPLDSVPPGLPKGCWQPSVPDLYRYSLAQNCVDVNLTGPNIREHIDAAFLGMEQGDLTPEEINYLNIYGDLHRNRLNPQDIPSEQLIYRG